MAVGPVGRHRRRHRGRRARRGLHALLTITIGVDHVVSGFAINIIAVGVTRFLATKLFVGQEGASQSFGPAIKGHARKIHDALHEWWQLLRVEES